MSRNAKPRNAREAQDRERALAAMARMRREKVSLRAAARAEDTDPKTVKRFVGSALRQDKSGRYRAKPYDRISRTLNFLTAKGSVPIMVRHSRTASKVAEHSNALREYRRTGDSSALAQFRAQSFRVNGVIHRFVTDPAVIDRLEDAGALTAIESLYYARITL
jgi:3-deoxy-D-arabino-heptulosonate 7-phosphate (DAHP) synthase class II